jgi:hypothetical protein
MMEEDGKEERRKKGEERREKSGVEWKRGSPWTQ